MENKYPLETIYKYTSNLLQSQEDSLIKLDNKISIFIGFSGVLTRLALDLPGKTTAGIIVKIVVCIFGIMSILISATGLLARHTGKVAAPETLMSDEWFFNKKEEEHQAYIINGWIDAMDEYELIIKKKQIRLYWVIVCFSTASTFFGFGVILSAFTT